MKKERLKYSIDNDKYKDHSGRSKQRVLITNMSSATDCEGKKRGTCQLKEGTKCYAECAEIQYKSVLPYRRAQEKQWMNHSSIWFNDQIKGIQRRARKKITHHRINEAGEVKGRNCWIKSCNIALSNKRIGIKTFTYTSNKELFTQCRNEIDSSPLVVNGSGFMAHNEYRVVTEGYTAGPNEYWCPDKCYNCQLCKKRLGVVILSKARHTKKVK
jgi:hypothetical protein